MRRARSSGPARMKCCCGCPRRSCRRCALGSPSCCGMRSTPLKGEGQQQCPARTEALGAPSLPSSAAARSRSSRWP
eukprot:8666496-Lingulodinium_polyedra.AAC.1